MGVSGQRHALATFYPQGNDPRYSLDRQLAILKVIWKKPTCKNSFKECYRKLRKKQARMAVSQ
jgi:hypothetical protein